MIESDSAGKWIWSRPSIDTYDGIAFFAEQNGKHQPDWSKANNRYISFQFLLTAYSHLMSYP
jgi:hypothetical protein